MTQQFQPDHLLRLPRPVGAVIGDWHLSEYVEDIYRTLTWSRHDVAGTMIAVEGAQYADGRIERHVVALPYCADFELTAADARRLAGALLDAAEVVDRLE
ncbi:hypothetical protein [Mycobacterium sp. NPDC050041]|uniref:hypothetical protein n=1 Tax=Mycobacterium sp. NPDC050041 TaxID=3364293 RepID=UPI003C2F55DB